MVIAFVLLILLSASCSRKEDNNQDLNYIWDLDKEAAPKFVDINYIELSKIGSISKYRSSVGHDYSDFTEHCRSMKHYFQPNVPDWSTVKIWSPVSGTITRVEQEWAGTKIEIESDQYPAFRFQIFHISLQGTRQVGEKITAGELLGNHISNETYSDVSVIVNDPTRQGRMVSWFDVITDKVFADYVLRGIALRSDMIISKELRDSNPLTCNGDTFTGIDPLDTWVTLN